jgi:hypothetical protein
MLQNSKRSTGFYGMVSERCRALATCGVKQELIFYGCSCEDGGARFVQSYAEGNGPRKLVFAGSLPFNREHWAPFINQQYPPNYIRLIGLSDYYVRAAPSSPALKLKKTEMRATTDRIPEKITKFCNSRWVPCSRLSTGQSSVTPTHDPAGTIGGIVDDNPAKSSAPGTASCVGGIIPIPFKDE